MEPQQTTSVVPILSAVISSLSSILVTWLVASLRARRRERSLYGQMQSDITKIKEQVFSNGGSSLRDAVNRIEGKIDVECERNRAYRYHDKNAFWECNTHGNILWCNPAMAKLLGVSKEEILNNAWMTMIHEEDIKRVRDDLRNGEQYGHSMIIDFRVYRPSKFPMLKLRTHWRTVPDHTKTRSTGYIGTVVSHEEVSA